MKKPKNCIYAPLAHCLVFCKLKKKCEKGKKRLKEYKESEE